MMGMAVALAEPYENNLHLDPDRQSHQHHALSPNFYRPDALRDAQPIVSKHGRHESYLLGQYTVCNNNYNNSHDNVYGVVIMTKVIALVHPVHLTAVSYTHLTLPTKRIV